MAAKPWRHRLPDGGTAAAPHSLDDAASCLHGCFDQIGRNGPWHPAGGSGIPRKSLVLKEMLQGYHKKMFSIGYA